MTCRHKMGYAGGGGWRYGSKLKRGHVEKAITRLSRHARVVSRGNTSLIRLLSAPFSVPFSVPSPPPSPLPSRHSPPPAIISVVPLPRWSPLTITPVPATYNKQELTIAPTPPDTTVGAGSRGPAAHQKLGSVDPCQSLSSWPRTCRLPFSTEGATSATASFDPCIQRGPSIGSSSISTLFP